MAELDFIEKNQVRQGEPEIIAPFNFKDHSDQFLLGKTDIIKNDFLTEYIGNSFFSRGFIANEKWQKNLFIQAKVSSFNLEYVDCLCLIDKENHYFETRSFPKYLFDVLENLKEKPYVILNIKSKPGSSRIDISDGNKIVDKALFELEEKWENFDDTGLNDDLNKEIKV